MDGQDGQDKAISDLKFQSLFTAFILLILSIHVNSFDSGLVQVG